MKLQPDRLEGVNMISRHDGGSVRIGGTDFRGSLLVPWRGEVESWGPASFADLAVEHFRAIADRRPEVVILGTGARLSFVRPALLAPLIELGIGVETMDSAAACRTYNVLVSEGRSVLAALLLLPG